MPVLLDLPGPSRRIRVEPLRLPEPARRAAPPAPAPVEPTPAHPAEREPAPVPDREREAEPVGGGTR